MRKEHIIIKGAREHNLKNISLRIPKNRITVFTGVSGSGKSSLVFDTIAAESQRQLNETFPSFIRHRLPHYGQPEADELSNLSPAVIIDQKPIGGNARSTVGTATDIFTLLRLLFSRIGEPFIGYSNIFSFNHPNGMCPECDGLGKVSVLDTDLFFDTSKSLNEGAILFPTFAKGGWRFSRYICSNLFDPDKKLRDYSEDEWHQLLYADGLKLPDPLPCWPQSQQYYEGIVPRFKRSYLSKDSKELTGRHKADFEKVLTRGECSACKGSRVNEKVRSCKIGTYNIADCAAMEIPVLANFINTITDPRAVTIVKAIGERLQQMMAIGLHYLTLDRDTGSLSGGESQRIKMVRHLGSSLSEMTYILDEPSIGLHPRDVHQLNQLLFQLRDKGNTVLVVEHDPDVIAIADHIVDIGPRAGTEGGKIVFEGPLDELKVSGTLTGRYWSRERSLRSTARQPSGSIVIKNATLHNLKSVTVEIPTGVLTVVTGVAGSGKSSLINGVLPKQVPGAVRISQSAISGSKRSHMATYTGIFDEIRSLFAKANKVKAALFSSNSEGGCKVCKGVGEITLDLAFMDPITTICEECGGKRYTAETLAYRFNGKNIYEALQQTVDEAVTYFTGYHDITGMLERLRDVGLGYLTLGQPLSTLSGGERQRIKLAMRLEDAENQLFIMDEPTTGLHMSDVDRLLEIFARIVGKGNTLVVVEHNLEVISQADHIIDMGPGAGREGGTVVFTGTPDDLIGHPASQTGKFLRQYLSQ
ncbi:excinuclease ABC subunit UvrA [Chitinophaga sp.]|uniref:excinuclease ABC subunit UvrA n=1 Tax=Chitinophaga sp. TaxID=1869181 RepID=UPI002626D215|nr:excinuclease ABC subunit UvrA [uncultured Chitinophaga sp.]